MEIITLIGFMAVAAAGFFAGQHFSSNKVEKKQLEKALKEKTEELEAFHSKVNNHFEKTAELFNHVSDSYQSLYDHMATSSNQLCASPTFQALPKNNPTQSVESSASSSTPLEVGPYSKLKRNSDKGIFGPDQLYNAHDYRNNSIDEKQLSNKDNAAEDITIPAFVEKQDQQDNKVVEIHSAKEEKDSHALDYAIKEKGVINHNSLDMEGVKNS